MLFLMQILHILNRQENICMNMECRRNEHMAIKMKNDGVLGKPYSDYTDENVVYESGAHYSGIC